MNPSRLTFHIPLNLYKVSRITAYSPLEFTPLFWLMMIGLLLPYYGSLPLGLPGRPVFQSVEEQLRDSLPLRCHMQAIAGDREQSSDA
jgi:hypothetical protein